MRSKRKGIGLFFINVFFNPLEAFVKVLEVFSPNLILCVSDELPPPGDIGKARLVSKLVERYQVKNKKDEK